MNSETNQGIVLKFVRSINNHNLEEMLSLMADNHRFVDSHGKEFQGKEKMEAAWRGYFETFPDYRIDVTDIFEAHNMVALFGSASGSFKGDKKKKDNSWQLPAAWKAILTEGKIELWQVYADTKIPFEIIDRNR
jgi:ketosteroid isomerase-like protein